MANPTTNYGFVLPTPTDLVTDLPADFDVALQGVDTQLKALQPGTTLGDIAYSSATANTNTRLGIGTTGQVLTVAGGVPSWATASAGGMTVIQSGSLSGTTTSLTSIPATYKDLRLVLRNVHMTPTSTVYQLQFNSDTGANYTYIWQNGTAATNVANSVNQFQTTAIFPNTSNNQCTIMMNVYDYASTTNFKLADLAAVGASGDPGVFNTAFYESSSAITSIQIKGNGQTVAGTYILYGIS
jgi:hypothetical protein